MKISTKHLLATFGMLTVVAVTPASALAGDRVHISVPGISIGFHGDNYSNRRYRKQYSKKRYYNNNRSYNNSYYNNRRYNNSYYSGSRSYNYDRNYNNYDRGYDYQYDRSYNSSYDRSYNNSYRGDGYRGSVCPIDGYSQSYDSNRNCYEHKGHYHCS